MYSIKIATKEDIPEVVKLAKLFKEESPYKDYLLEESKLTTILFSLLEDPSKHIVLLSTYNSTTIGMVVGTSAEFLFSTDKHATELAWYVYPEYRKSTVGKDLQEAFVYWAKKVGCKYLHMVLLEDHNAPKMKKLYKKLGFKLIEQAWIKELT